MAKRRRAGPTGRDQRFQKLRALGCFDEAYERICSGWPITQVARFIQDERREYTDISRKGLEQQLTEFRKSIPATHLVAKRFPDIFDKALERVEEGIDELEELAELYRIQKNRIAIDYKTEKSIHKLLPSMTAEIREARQILESMSTLKMDLGINHRAPKNVDVSGTVELDAPISVSQFGSERVQKVLDDPESRRRVAGVMERFMKLPPAKVVPKDTN